MSAPCKSVTIIAFEYAPLLMASGDERAIRRARLSRGA